ncbi:Hypothetical_protein [Hexamita inflata]|uniref:Hypothetical_protein n=1 Tax=Hexamita inflata TaxID=28002 RepID=A0AA86U0U9_9EUKA|nr:Hypothetical protein HINF_LOCUS23624 [Hexamita inflata]
MLISVLTLNCFACAFSQNSETQFTVINLNQICGSNSTTQIQVLHENVPVFSESFQTHQITIQTPLQANLLIIATLDGLEYKFRMKTLQNGLNSILIIVALVIVVLIIFVIIIVLKMIQKYKRKMNVKKHVTPANSTNVTMIADESSLCTGKRVDGIMEQQYY